MTITATPTSTERDYDWLKSAVARWLHRSDLTEVIPDLIALGEARIYRDLRLVCMETELSGEVSNGALFVPDDYIELKHARTDDGTLERRSAGWIHDQGDDTGTTRYIARQGAAFIFYPTPSDGEVIEGIYYARFDPLSDANTTNWFTVNAPDLLLFAALSEAAPYLANDARIPVWEGKYASVKAALQAESDNEAYSGSPLAML